MTERFLFFRCFMRKGPLLYLERPKIQFFYPPITRYKNNMDGSKISLILDISIRRHTNKTKYANVCSFLKCLIKKGSLLHLEMLEIQSLFYF